MFYIPKIDNYLRILAIEQVKDFVAINFSVYFKDTIKAYFLLTSNIVLDFTFE